MPGAWLLFHNGKFQTACNTGVKAGGDGITAANKAACIYANYLETKEKPKLDMSMGAADRAEVMQQTDPKNANQADARDDNPRVSKQVTRHVFFLATMHLVGEAQLAKNHQRRGINQPRTMAKLRLGADGKQAVGDQHRRHGRGDGGIY